VQRRLEDGLQGLLADTEALKSNYSVILDVWVDSEGRITRTELVSGSGKADIDQAIRTALPKLKAAVGKPPPDNMQQPIKIRLTARG
jgi:TonB family protein